MKTTKRKKDSGIELVSRLNRSKIKFILMFGVPTLLFYFYLFVNPIFDSIITSFTNWNGFDATKTFVGLDNYKNIFSDEIFYKAVKNDFIIILFKEIFICALALLFAISITRIKLVKTEKAFYRFVYYIPNILSIIVITTVWSFVMNPSIGLLNAFLKLVGLSNLIPGDGWLVSYTVPVIIFIASWCAIGFYMILIISAINNVPTELYEASEIDGAGQWNQFITITLPEIWAQIRYMLVTILFGSLASNMGLILPLTNGGPNNKSIVMGLFVYQRGMTSYRVGYADAAAVILMLITMILSLTVNYLLHRREEK